MFNRTALSNYFLCTILANKPRPTEPLIVEMRLQQHQKGAHMNYLVHLHKAKEV